MKKRTEAAEAGQRLIALVTAEYHGDWDAARETFYEAEDVFPEMIQLATLWIMEHLHRLDRQTPGFAKEMLTAMGLEWADG